ncbi:hypothetical protein [Salinarchaeum sp. Harcht-Bsk1]|uniref:hypothetical protein n=1 Tax=Salinarchaeum sp. Harcht-Bsk1 TaxID=1333523 RepID=UPI0016516069|nr:hypothetical protein [Salinarchaeum sp. Harcht-Bsk1]
MSQSATNRDVEAADEGLAKLIAGITIGWIVVFFLASVGLVLFGDVLMEAFV